MYSKCPICGKVSTGMHVSSNESSLLKSAFKLYYSFIVPVPFIGAKVGAKIYDICSSTGNSFYRFICDECICSWVSSSDRPEVKIGGCEKLLFYFNEGALVLGSIKDNIYIIQTQDKDTMVSYLNQREQVEYRHYKNGVCVEGSRLFGNVNLNSGKYIGELINGKPNGWGILLQNDGFLTYGEWEDNHKNGISFSCDYDGKKLSVSYYQKGKRLM